MFDVVGIGESVVDVVGIVNTLPKENTKKDIALFRQFVGGSALNAILTLSYLGCKTSFISRVGNDDYGSFIKNELGFAGVNTDNLKEIKTKTPFHFVMLSKKTQSRTIFKKKNKKIQIKNLSDYDKYIISKSKILILDRKSELIPFDFLKQLKRKKVLISFDPSDKYNAFTKKLISLANFLIVPEGFRKFLKNNKDNYKAVRELWSLNKGIVVMTVGPNGCLAYDGKKMISMPRYNKKKIVDTNGAGDVFHGAFVYGALHRWSLKKICKFANKIAALKCSIIGNRLQKLNIQKFIKNKKKN